jgi:WD40 repeat protein
MILTKILRTLLLVAMAACMGSPGGASAQLSTEPILRIEAGAHLSLVTRVSTDAQGRWIVSASEDKTARVWDATTGRLLSVLRPPVGPESVGALYAAVLSPDGKQVALGGNAAFDGKSHSLYLFDRSTGRLPPKSTLSGLEAPLTQLAWSKDSQFVAVGLRQSGLRIFQRNLAFVGSDPEYNEAIYGADFAADGRLVTCSLDGSIRLYRVDKRGLTRTARKQMPGGRPYAVAFSPDGSLIAVGYQDAGHIDVLDASSLSVRYSTAATPEGNLGRVAWTADGSLLIGAGTARASEHFAVFGFADAGRGPGRELAGFSNIVTSLAPLRDGFIAASAEPSWATFDGSGKRRLFARPQTGDFRDADDKFKVAADAQRVSFPTTRGGEALLFDLAKGDIRAYTADAKVDPPRLPGWSGGPSNWKNSTAPKVGSRALALRPGEVSRSVALSPDKQRFVLGTEWYLRAFDGDGNPLWEQRTPAAAWAVNISGDGRWVLAALGDGTVRWYRMQDGKEQLSLFVHVDGKRWIIWSPAGYYDTSLDGEDLVGWHLNRGMNQASDFFSVGRFRDRFYRPEIIQGIVQTMDEGEAVRRVQAAAVALAVSEPTVRPTAVTSKPAAPVPPPQAPLAFEKTAVATVLPPVIDLQTDSQIETSANTVPVRFALRSPPDAPVSEVKVRVNDKLVRSLDNRALRSTRGDVQEVQVAVPPVDSQIRLFAANKNGKSEPVVVNVRRSVEPAKVTEARFEKLYLLIIGVSKYPEEWKLDLAEKDAQDFNYHMVRQAGKLYGTAVPRLLINEQATREKILEGLRWLRENVGEKDAGIVFMAGHGDRVGPAYYFIPGDPDVLPSRSAFKSTQEFDLWKQKNAPQRWVPGEEISRTLLGLKGRAAFFIDTCHSGVNARPGQSTNPDLTKALNEINEERGVIVFASSTGKELSQEDPAWGNGAFTKAIIEGIRGGADFRKDGLIRPSTLQSYVTERVMELTKKEQRPVVFTVGIDDPIAVKSQ